MKYLMPHIKHLMTNSAFQGGGQMLRPITALALPFSKCAAKALVKFNSRVSTLKGGVSHFGQSRIPSTITVTFCLFVLIISCKNEVKAPVERETFVHILTDMHTAEAAAEGEFTTVKDSLLKIYYPQILKKHGVNQVDFDSTMTLYSREPILFDSIYAQVFREIAKIDTTKH